MPTRTSILAIWLSVVMLASVFTPIAAATEAGTSTGDVVLDSQPSPAQVSLSEITAKSKVMSKSGSGKNESGNDGNPGNGNNGNGDSGPSGSRNVENGYTGFSIDKTPVNGDSGGNAANDSGSSGSNGNQDDNAGSANNDNDGNNGQTQGKSGNSQGNSGKSGNGKPDDAGKSGDAGKPDDTGKSEDAGKSEEAGNRPDSDQPRRDSVNGQPITIPGKSDESDLGAGSERSVTTAPDPPAVSVSPDDEGSDPIGAEADASSVNVTVRDVSPNQQVEVDVSPDDIEEGNAAFDSISLRAKRGGSFTMTVTTSRDPLPGSPLFDETGAFSLARVRLDHSISNEDVEDVSFTFRLSKQRLRSTSTDPEAVVLYRYANNEWNALETEFVGETKTHYLFEAEAPGLSEFAIGAERPDFDLWYSDVRSGSDHSVKVVGRVTNVGGADGVFSATLTIQGTPVAMQEITIASGGTRQFTFEHTFRKTGTYQLYINDQLAGTITVEPDDLPGAEDDADVASTGVFGLPFHWAVALDEGLGLFTPVIPLASI